MISTNGSAMNAHFSCSGWTIASPRWTLSPATMDPVTHTAMDLDLTTSDPHALATMDAATRSTMDAASRDALDGAALNPLVDRAPP